MSTPIDALRYLGSFVNFEKTGFKGLKRRRDLGKLRDALGKMGDPERQYRVAHVAGTKGKGSVCAFTASILASSGYRTGLYLSPHISSETERISVDGKNITEKEMAAVLEGLMPYLGRTPREDFTYFELFTLIAIKYFSMEKVDFAVFETGIGGRLDATNVTRAEVYGLSPISYDHMHVLGNTLPEIASEKAAIIKHGSHVVSAPQRPAVMRVIRARCKGQKASISVVGSEIKYAVNDVDDKGVSFNVTTDNNVYRECRTILPGYFQAVNCATAIGICEKLLENGLARPGAIGGHELKRGIEKAFLPGRLEVLGKEPYVVIDGAQNADSARELMRSVNGIFRYDRLVLIIGLCMDKDIAGFCNELVSSADKVILTRFSSERSADTAVIKGYVKKKDVCETKDIKEALGVAFKYSSKKDLILITGSFYLIGEARRMIVG